MNFKPKHVVLTYAFIIYIFVDWNISQHTLCAIWGPTLAQPYCKELHVSYRSMTMNFKPKHVVLTYAFIIYICVDWNISQHTLCAIWGPKLAQPYCKELHGSYRSMTMNFKPTHVVLTYTTLLYICVEWNTSQHTLCAIWGPKLAQPYCKELHGSYLSMTMNF